MPTPDHPVRWWLLGAAVSLIADSVVIGAGVAFGNAQTTSADRVLGQAAVMLLGLLVLGPPQLLGGVLFTAGRRTRPFGFGLLLGSAPGLLVMLSVIVTALLQNMS